MARALALVRNSWRQLTSMRTALVLLFLLAVAAIPGSVLPQKDVSIEDVQAYVRANPELGPWVDRLWGFEVFASPWFSAIYLLLFASLIGCIVPRLRDHVRALRAVPPNVPRRLDRLPQHAGGEQRDGDPAAVAQRVRSALRRRRWRAVAREQGDGTWTVSAEKGYLKETGNLVFHTALIAVLLGVAAGSWYGWHGNRLLVAGADRAFCNTVQQFDEYGLGPRVDATDLPGFCLELTDFEATFRPSKQPESFRAEVRVDRDGARPARTETFSVNDPLRLGTANVYLFGHGYAPVIRYTDRFGVAQTTVTPFLPLDESLTSEGAAKFPDANVDPATGQRAAGLQVGFEGLYLPTAPDAPPFTRSVFPTERSPGLMLWAYRGDLGENAGIPNSVYQIDRDQVDAGRLTRVGEPRLLRVGESWKLDDGTTVEFLGTEEWITLSVRRDPGEPVALAGVVVGLLGLMLSLAGKRRRVFFRISPADPDPTSPTSRSSLVEAGGLPRADYPGFADEFADVVADARGPATADQPPAQPYARAGRTD
jgi:cytochrome c biogenesis protein